MLLPKSQRAANEHQCTMRSIPALQLALALSVFWCSVGAPVTTDDATTAGAGLTFVNGTLRCIVNASSQGSEGNRWLRPTKLAPEPCKPPSHPCPHCTCKCEAGPSVHWRAGFCHITESVHLIFMQLRSSSLALWRPRCLRRPHHQNGCIRARVDRMCHTRHHTH